MNTAALLALRTSSSNTHSCCVAKPSSWSSNRRRISCIGPHAARAVRIPACAAGRPARPDTVLRPSSLLTATRQLLGLPHGYRPYSNSGTLPEQPSLGTLHPPTARSIAASALLDHYETRSFLPCEHRGRDVTVRRITDTRIPWPATRCGAAHIFRILGALYVFRVDRCQDFQAAWSTGCLAGESAANLARI